MKNFLIKYTNHVLIEAEDEKDAWEQFKTLIRNGELNSYDEAEIKEYDRISAE
jgi:hypothetical protein